ncbi:GNAT family N-acetyltransferase [Nonomuraea rhizosphaerae]|uniref:GNAT family N-acetyltransferase n=1 Tax=Nonomuraea rhizosphaerae TaxID=2665663 RepID=UPI001C5DB482|nr:GNAT family protein [Nonomuraea rhizosphaerae]
MRNWPLFELSVTTPRLELRMPSLADLDELGDRAAEGVHDPGFMPFLFPWSDAEPLERARATIRYQFRNWAEFAKERWSLELVVVSEGKIVGVQGVSATDFLVTREVGTGSWLGKRFQGRGIGREMRAAVLHLAFEGLDAHEATTEAFEDNHASLAVTRRLGYQPDGIALHNRQGTMAVTKRFRLQRADWKPMDGIKIHNLEPCLPLFGL